MVFKLVVKDSAEGKSLLFVISYAWFLRQSRAYYANREKEVGSRPSYCSKNG